MHRKKLKELNLLDDFLFFKMLNYPEFEEDSQYGRDCEARQRGDIGVYEDF